MNESARRLGALQRRLVRENVDAIYVGAAVNIRYLTGFTGSAGRLLATPDAATLFTDGRYRLQAARQAPGVDLVISHSDALGAMLEAASRMGLERMAFESARLSYADWARLGKALPSTSLVADDGWVEQARMVKSAVEVDALRAAAALNAACFQAVIERVRPEWTEIETAGDIESEMRRRGGAGPAFATIVAAGEHGALPHAAPRNEPLGRGRLIVVDHGVILGGYVSDQTRLIAFGDPGAEARRLVAAVSEAQLAGLGALQAGVAAKSIDRAARRVLEQRKLGSLFVHSTGHGLGLEIHESPKLGQDESTRLRSGMTVTVEPGVYQDGFAGARVEDAVVIKPDGFESLTPSIPALQIL